MLFDSQTSLLAFIETTIHPSSRRDKALAAARTKAYGFIANYVKACGRMVLAHRVDVLRVCFNSYVFEEVSAAKLASLAPVKEVLLLRAFPAKDLRVSELLQQLMKDVRLGRARPTVQVCVGLWRVATRTGVLSLWQLTWCR